MKLYYSKGACSLAIRITIHELGITSEFEAVNLKMKQTETGKDFRAINPKGAVPVVVTDKQEILTENVAIQQYLADKHNNTELLPAINDIRRYQVIGWLSYVGSELHKTASALFNASIPQDLKNTFFKPMFETKLHYVDHYLQNQKHKFLTGDSFTIADSYMYVVLSWLRLFEMDIAKWPTLASYTSAITQRPAVQQALKEEGLI